jgi:hypothetical protein
MAPASLCQWIERKPSVFKGFVSNQALRVTNVRTPPYSAKNCQRPPSSTYTQSLHHGHQRHHQKRHDPCPHRSLLRATGALKSEADFQKPFIAVVGEKVRESIYAAGSTPFEFNTIGVDDGISTAMSA